MTYELWDLPSKNMIDWFESRTEAIEAVRAYVDADEATLIMLIEHEDVLVNRSRSMSGNELVAWLETAQAKLRPTA